MTTLFAQADIGALKAEFLKQLLIAMFAFGVLFSFVIGAIVAVLQYRMEKRNKEKEEKRDKESKPREIYPQPLETIKASKRYNHDAINGRFDAVEEKIERHDSEISELRETVTALSLDIGKQIADMPGKIVVDILNAKKL